METAERPHLINSISCMIASDLENLLNNYNDPKSFFKLKTLSFVSKLSDLVETIRENGNL